MAKQYRFQPLDDGFIPGFHHLVADNKNFSFLSTFQFFTASLNSGSQKELFSLGLYGIQLAKILGLTNSVSDTVCSSTGRILLISGMGLELGFFSALKASLRLFSLRWRLIASVRLLTYLSFSLLKMILVLHEMRPWMTTSF